MMSGNDEAAINLEMWIVFASRVNADVEGEYKFCFDNTFSRMSPKVVFFEIISDYDDDEDDDDWNINHEEVVGMVDLTVEEFKVWLKS